MHRLFRFSPLDFDPISRACSDFHLCLEPHLDVCCLRFILPGLLRLTASQLVAVSAALIFMYNRNSV